MAMALWKSITRKTTFCSLDRMGSLYPSIKFTICLMSLLMKSASFLRQSFWMAEKTGKYPFLCVITTDAHLACLEAIKYSFYTYLAWFFLGTFSTLADRVGACALKGTNSKLERKNEMVRSKDTLIPTPQAFNPIHYDAIYNLHLLVSYLVW